MKRFLLLLLLVLIAACTRTETITLDGQGSVDVECLPVYGNWCGQGYPAYEVTGNFPVPVDVWDDACKAHDLCYDKYGDGGKRLCDSILSDEIDRLYDKGYPVPHAMSAAYLFFKRDFRYNQVWISADDFRKPMEYSCKGGDGKAALFCDVGKGRDDCQADTTYFLETGECFCDYSKGLWEDSTRIWGTRLYSATK